MYTGIIERTGRIVAIDGPDGETDAADAVDPDDVAEPDDTAAETDDTATDGTVAQTDRTTAHGRAAEADRTTGDAGYTLRIETDVAGLSPEDSVAISGVCVTATAVGDGWFTCDCSGETVDRTYLAACDPGTAVNVERPLPVDGRFHGHVVTGTVDATTTIAAIEERDDEWRYRFALPDCCAPYVVEKGAVALDGISLTVAAVDDEGFEVAVVPITREVTTLSERSVGDPVHVEADVLAKYVRDDQPAPSGGQRRTASTAAPAAVEADPAPGDDE